jgi:cilia- and flagella-associated protein 57
LAVSPNRKIIAVAERTSERGIVTLYEAGTLKKKKVLSYLELNSKEIVSVCFSNDSKFVLTQGGAPDWSLVLWNIEKIVKVRGQKRWRLNDHCDLIAPCPPHKIQIVCTLKLFGPVAYKGDFCPSDPNVICVSGEGMLRFFRIQEGSFRPIPLVLKREAQNYLSHCWLDSDKVRRSR